MAKQVETRSIQTAFRCTPSELALIDERAGEVGMTRSAYMIAASLGELPGQRRDELASVRKRLRALENSKTPAE